MKKTYLCGRWPSFSIRRLYFQNGVYTTDDAAEQALIEGSQQFSAGNIILAPAGVMQAIAEGSGAQQGTRSTRTGRTEG